MSQRIKATTLDEIEKQIPINQPIKVTLNHHELCAYPGENFYGYFAGILPEEKVNELIRDRNHGFHYMVSLRSANNEHEFLDLHLGIIEAIDLVSDWEVTHPWETTSEALQ